MVVPMMSGPPQRPTLGCAGAQDTEEKLCNTAGLEGFVGKVAMVEAGDGKHAHGEKPNAKMTAQVLVPVKMTSKQAR